MREDVARLDEQHVRKRKCERPIHDEHSSMPRVGMFREDRGPDHRPVVRNDSGMVRNQQRATARGHVLHAVDFNPPVIAVEPQRNVLDALSEFRVKAEAVAFEFQLAAGTHHAQGPHLFLNYHVAGLDMPLDLKAAADEYIGWLQLEANRSLNTVRAYDSEIRKLMGFLAANNHSLRLDELRHEDLRAYQRYLAGRLKSPASRAG